MWMARVPSYLRERNIDFRVYLAEQRDSSPFNISISRNVAATVALDEGWATYFVIHDVDIIPVEGVDYGPWEFDASWLLSAGTCKIRKDSFVAANGYNPHFIGWGCEDVEFYHRISSLGFDLRWWPHDLASHTSVAINLEWPTMSEAGDREWSRGYFLRTDDVGPKFVSYRGNITRPDKRQNFLCSELETANRKLCDDVQEIPSEGKAAYFAANGMNLASSIVCGRAP